MIKNYDRSKAIIYAQKWALGSNPAFYHFGGIGGDCTNFISQCLFAGGGKMNFEKNGWFYVDSNYRSPSWTSVKFFREFLIENKSIGPFGHLEKLENLQVGDIIQLRQNPTHFNHTLIITNIYGNNIYVCAHSNDALNKSLYDYNFEEAIGIAIDGIRI